MLKKTITYTDFDGKERTEDFYFNLTKAELAEMEVSVDGGLGAWAQKISETPNAKDVLAIFKKLILKAYGEKTLDGRRFLKNQEIHDSFAQTEAYSELLMEMLSDADAAVAFVKGLTPTVTDAK